MKWQQKKQHVLNSLSVILERLQNDDEFMAASEAAPQDNSSTGLFMLRGNGWGAFMGSSKFVAIRPLADFVNQ